MRITPLTPHIGAELSDIDIASPLSNQQQQQIYQAFLDYSVIFFRDQQLQPQQQLSFARLFGKIENVAHPKFSTFDDAPEVSIIINDKNNPPDINVWHTDLTYLRKPPKACVLYCQETPDTGGDTLWVSMQTVYQSLSKKLQDQLRTLTAKHQLPLDNASKEQIRQVFDKDITAIHPVICTHPESQEKHLFINSVYTKKIIELNTKESNELLNMLFTLSIQPEFQVRFKWQQGSMAIWDNRCTQHYAVADYYPQRRVMHRVSISAD